MVYNHQGDSLGRKETGDGDYTYLLLLLIYDSRAAASNDEEMGECVLVDWRE